MLIEIYKHSYFYIDINTDPYYGSVFWADVIHEPRSSIQTPLKNNDELYIYWLLQSEFLEQE
jgi:restriction endonuclease S subunit